MLNLPLATSSWGPEELEAIQRVIHKDMYSMSDYVFEFEKAFASFVGSKYAVMVNSGSSANLAAVAALFYKKENPLKRGDEVIVPAVSWSTTYHPLYQYGCKLVFVDVDLETLNYDLEQLESAMTDKTRMVCAVNLLGNPNDFDRIKAIIGKRDIILWEDNCESLGATYKGQQTGTIGLMGTYSTFFSHHIATMEGGLVVTNDEELHHILLCLRAHGWTRNLPKENKVTGTKSDDPFEESFKFVLPGYNLRPVEMSGSIGLEQLKKLPGFIEQRKVNAKKFVDLFADHPNFIIQKEIGESSWFGFSLILKEGAPYTRKEIISRLQESNVDCRPIVSGNFAKNPVIKKYYDYRIHGQLKNADWLDQNGFFIGNHQIDLIDSLAKLRELLR